MKNGKPVSRYTSRRVKRCFFDFDWNVDQVWKIEVLTSTMSMDEMEWHLSLPFWSSVEGEPLFDVVPQDVLDNPESYPGHYKRIVDADLSFPIDVMFNKERHLILDGMHRLAKLRLNECSEIQVRVIPREAIGDIKKNA